MRFHLSLFLAVFAAIAFANDPPIDITEAENQFTQATVDAVVIDGACAQIRTDRKSCYQRASLVTAQCREQLRVQYIDTSASEPSIDRDNFIAALKNCGRL